MVEESDREVSFKSGKIARGRALGEGSPGRKEARDEGLRDVAAHDARPTLLPRHPLAHVMPAISIDVDGVNGERGQGGDGDGGGLTSMLKKAKDGRTMARRKSVAFGKASNAKSVDTSAPTPFGTFVPARKSVEGLRLGTATNVASIFGGTYKSSPGRGGAEGRGDGCVCR